MSNISVKIDDNSAAWQAEQESRLMTALMRMGVAGKNIAIMTTPMSEGGGNLRNSGRVQEDGHAVIISFGNSEVQYAAAQEAGHRGPYPFRKYTTPGTGAHFLKKGAETAVSKGIKAYL